MRDFTLAKYGELLEVVLSAGLPVFGIAAWLPVSSQAKAAIIRHDVDRRPGRALNMAKLESRMGVHTTYYFRMVGSAYCERTIRAVADLGHEIGYHYEDLALANGNIHLALDLFSRNLEKLRKMAKVETIAMHGSPMSHHHNLDLWNHAKISEYSVVADAFLSIDYRGIYYFTDTGRGWDRAITNLRDRPPGVASSGLTGSGTPNLIRFLSGNEIDKIALSVHPERWNDDVLPWLSQLIFDSSCNAVKAATALIRAPATRHRP